MTSLPIEIGKEALARLPSDSAIASDLCLPFDFITRLRKYQKEAILWMDSLLACGMGCLLADDMGLGKTVQALAAVSSSFALTSRGEAAAESATPSVSMEGESAAASKLMLEGVRKGVDPADAPVALIVCPSSVVHHWASECSKFLGERLRPVAFIGNSTKQLQALAEIAARRCNVLIAPYSALRRGALHPVQE